ncbi:hypothetical protein [Dyella mobilis]|uniref:PH domain-containing protein n=1 Tax=Dyella mobilis TaxID=1849582 RepID=A0ABS2KD60_9GAMM|nr:hypothetical protein [Dyella mobilis]MBM7128818.1 hypothetical protein [Dyella mobilis]GLQ99150.1 hypothetical protein GCM10007863_35700 [Dyella mobilis]
MANDVRVFRASRFLSVLLGGLAVIFAVAMFLSNDGHVLPLGYVLGGMVPVAIAAASVFAWRYGVCVGDTTIEAGVFRRTSYALKDATSIDVQRTKVGRVAAVRFSDGRILRFDQNLVGFDDLLSLISQRSSLPVRKPVWDP